MQLEGKIEVKKIKLTGKRSAAELAFDLILDDGTVCECKASVGNQPQKALLVALDKLLSVVIETQNLDCQEWETHGCVTGLSLKDEENGYGCTVTVQRIDGACAPVNSRYMPADEVDQQSLEMIVVQAEKYLTGQSGAVQGSLSLDKEAA